MASKSKCFNSLPSNNALNKGATLSKRLALQEVIKKLLSHRCNSEKKLQPEAREMTFTLINLVVLKSWPDSLLLPLLSCSLPSYWATIWLVRHKIKIHSVCRHGNKRLRGTSRLNLSAFIGPLDNRRRGSALIGRQSDLAGASRWGEGAKLCESGQ